MVNRKIAKIRKKNIGNDIQIVSLQIVTLCSEAPCFIRLLPDCHDHNIVHNGLVLSVLLKIIAQLSNFGNLRRNYFELGLVFKSSRVSKTASTV